VDYEIHVIEQHPLRLAVAFHMGGMETHAGESLLYFIRDGLDLPRVATAGNDKIIGERRRLSVHLQDGEILCLFRLGGADCLRYSLPQLAGFHWPVGPQFNPKMPSVGTAG
jgi:hypothetical protein